MNRLGLDFLNFSLLKGKELQKAKEWLAVHTRYKNKVQSGS
jgi:hypothetical protein